MKKKILLGIAAAAAIAVGSLSASAAGFAKTNTYTPGMFNDVPASEWYASSVSSSYELGFMKGTADGVFSPEGNMTVAIVAHDRVGQKQAIRIFFFCFFGKGADGFNLVGTAQKAGIDGVERRTKRLPMCGNLGHFGGKVEKGKAGIAAGMGRKKRGRQRADLVAASRKHR